MPKQPSPKHGGYALGRLYRERKLDGRTELSRDVRSIENALAEERGGWERCSVAEKVLFEPLAYVAVWLRLLNRHIAAQGGLLDPTGQPIGAAKLYFVNFNSLVRACAALGLKPPDPEPALSLQEYLAARSTPQPDAQRSPQSDDHGPDGPVALPAPDDPPEGA